MRHDDKVPVRCVTRTAEGRLEDIVLTMRRDDIIERIARDGEDRPDRNMADLCVGRNGDAHRPLCPSGLVDSTNLYAIDIEAQSDRLKAPPFAGGAIEQPAAILDAMRIISHRRALHQRRTIADMNQKRDRAARI